MANYEKQVLDIKEDLLKDLERLIAIPSVHDATTAKEHQPFGTQCKIALDTMLDIGKRDGYETYNDDGYAGHIDIGTGDEVVGILGHLDVVPVEEEGWKTDPFKMTEIDGRLYGRGVSDDKGPLLAAYYAAKIVEKEGLIPCHKRIRVIFGCNEELGSSCVKHYFSHMPYPAYGFTPDADFPLIYGEKGHANIAINGKMDMSPIVSMNAGLRANVVPARCDCVVEGPTFKYSETFRKYLTKEGIQGNILPYGTNTKLTVFGQTAHASTPELGNNGVILMCKYLNTIISHPMISYIAECLDTTDGSHLGIAYTGRLGALTMNLGIIEASDKAFKISLDLRVPHEIDQIDLLNTIAETCPAYDTKGVFQKALIVEPDSPLVQKLQKAYEDVSGEHYPPQAIGGGTYAKQMPNCVAFGPQFSDMIYHIHENNEFMDIERFIKTIEIYVEGIKNLMQD